MQKNLSKVIVALIAISCAFYFFKQMDTAPQTLSHPEQIPSSHEEVEHSNELPTDFHNFYNSFHSDSLYQMSHIVFPLKGIGKSRDTSETLVEKQWVVGDWILHKPFNNHGGTFDRSFTNVSGIVTETITGNGGMFSMVKRYSKLADEWHLIYYQELIMRG